MLLAGVRDTVVVCPLGPRVTAEKLQVQGAGVDVNGMAALCLEWLLHCCMPACNLALHATAETLLCSDCCECLPCYFSIVPEHLPCHLTLLFTV